MSNSFAGLSAPEYDLWRQAAEFHRVERTIVERMITLSCNAPRRVLDLGCGTGTWTRTVARLYPAARVLGVDLSLEMLAYARQTSEPRVSYLVGDCCRLPTLGEFDLVICAMSADYIGFQCVTRAVANVLSTAGVALLWVLDPSTYEMRDGRRIKKWIVSGQLVYETAAVFDPISVCDHFVIAGLRVTTQIEEIHLSDGKPRRLLVYVLRRAAVKIADSST
jgi:SAM-dependent methyltransferase